jgi:hypothetical protein
MQRCARATFAGIELSIVQVLVPTEPEPRPGGPGLAAPERGPVFDETPAFGSTAKHRPFPAALVRVACLGGIHVVVFSCTAQ